MRAARYRCPASVGLGVWLLCALAAPPLAAQPSGTPPASGEASPSDAARLFEEGSAAAKQNQWEKARVAFQKAWTLKKHWQIAANLGRAELMLKRYRDAAEHLAYFLRESPANPEDRKMVQGLFDQARARVGELKITVNEPGALVLVDGAVVGTSPLKEPVFVDPGRKQVEAALDGYTTSRRGVKIDAGGTATTDLRLRKGGAEGGVAQAGPPAEAEGDGADSALADTGGKAKGSAQTSSSAYRAIQITGLAATTVAAGVTVVFYVLSSAKAREAADHDRTECDGNPDTCAYNEAERGRAAFANVSFTSGVIAGVLGAGTLVYTLVNAPSSKNSASAGFPVRVSIQGSGFAVMGRW